jgi:hypothetical protein
VETLWSSENEAAYAIHLQSDSRFLFSTGTKGSQSILWARTRNQPALRHWRTPLAPAARIWVVCTSNLPRLFSANGHGSYEPEARVLNQTSARGASWRARCLGNFPKKRCHRKHQEA